MASFGQNPGCTIFFTFFWSIAFVSGITIETFHRPVSWFKKICTPASQSETNVSTFCNDCTYYRLRLTLCPHRLLPERQWLPVFQHRVQVLEALRRHRVVVIAGETGSGKSTQIPQFILEEILGKEEKEARQCNVVVTQPRRISAMSLASRVNQELGSEDQPGSKVRMNF